MMSIYDKQFVPLTVLAFDDATKTGLVRDQQGCDYRVTAQDLAEVCDGCLFPGEEVEGFVLGFDRVSDIQPSDLAERKNFDSVGPAPDAVGWTPAIPGPGSSANPSYCPGAKPDSGRFSHPRDLDPK